MIRGRDVSHYQGAVNWKSLKAVDGLSFGMAKCTQGVSFFDPEYVANRDGCKAAGLPFIAYHFAEPGASSPVTQARLFVARAGAVEGYCLDLETSTLSQSATNAWMRAFGDELRRLAPGATTFVYLGGYAANGSGQGSVNHFDHWIYPHYTTNNWPTTYNPQVGGNTTGWHVPPAPAMWQCSDNIRGMDALVSNLTIDQLFSGADMPLSAADIQAIWDFGIVTKRDASGNKVPASAFLSSIDVNVVNPNPGAVAEIAAAVVAALPPAQSGGLTTDQVKQAVKDALREGVS